MSRIPQPENEAIRACWAQARREVTNKATGHAECEEVRQRTVEVFQERYLDMVEWEDYGTHYSRIVHDAKEKALVRKVARLQTNNLKKNRQKVCEVLNAVKDLPVASMPKHLARKAIDKALLPVYHLTITIPSPNHRKHWEKQVSEITFEEMARCGQLREKLITKQDEPSMEKFQFVADVGLILGAQANDKLEPFFHKTA